MKKRSLTARIGTGLGLWLLTLGTIVGVRFGIASAASEPDGTTSDNAAASCWAIKQDYPASPDGTYWLQTPALIAPQQFHCDMTTDGGGWVLIGRGRQSWSFRQNGQGTAEDLRTVVSGTGAFAPAALNSTIVDGLLNNTAVKDLDDGVRVRRAGNTGGTTWQELRWFFLDNERWSWALGAGHRLSNVTISGPGAVSAAFTGGNTKDSQVLMSGEVAPGNRGANNFERWHTQAWSGHNGQAGFAYGASVTGSTSSTSHLWVASNGQNQRAIPFTQVYIRPKFMSFTYPAIPDPGEPGSELTPLLSTATEPLQSGVIGALKVGDSEPALDTPVLAFAEFGDRIYVGGKFSNVELNQGASQNSQSYLAAFDRQTGAYISSFTPTLDGTVWDLDVTPDGKLLVAGQFTNIDGQPFTTGLAALDPTTGAVIPSWRASLTLSGSTRPLARAIDIEGDWVYVGGNFTSIDGLSGTVAEARLGRVALANGAPDTAFRPDVDGVTYEIDATPTRVYAVGDFKIVNGAAANAVAVLNPNDGALVPGILPYVTTATNPDRQYQQAVMALGDEVWLGGSEHNTQAYNSSDFSLIRSYITANRGGDAQSLATVDGIVYSGSHANAWVYWDSTAWPNADNFTRADEINWIGAWDATTHDYVREWVPSLDTQFDEGAWSLYVDADDCMWFGGDFSRGSFVGSTPQYLRGFGKFCPRDIVAPSTPANFAADLDGAGDVTLSWSASSDAVDASPAYEVLRNDRVIAGPVYDTSYFDPNATAGDRYFVRAIDATGNRSATTSVSLPADLTNPSTPQDLAAAVLAGNDVQLTWTASTDNVAVTGYAILRNGIELTQVPGTTTVVSGLPAGDNYLQVQALDAAGNRSFKTPPVLVTLVGGDTTPPSTPQNLAATVLAGNDVQLTWTASTDNVAVTGYAILRNGIELTQVTGTTTTLTGLPLGNNYLQVQALDAAGNRSLRTPPILVVLN